MAQIDQLLEDEELYQMIRQDLARRFPQTWQTDRNLYEIPRILSHLGVQRNANFSCCADFG